MTKQKKEWISVKEAAEILTSNTDHEIGEPYVRLLVQKNRITTRRKNGRENEYLKSDVEAIHVRPLHTPRVRPRPSTRRTAKSQEQKPDLAPSPA